MLALPGDVLAQIRGRDKPRIHEWVVDPTELDVLLGALGRTLRSADIGGFVSNSRMAFAVGDEIVYPKTADEATDLTTHSTAIVQRLERGDPVFRRLTATFATGTARIVSASAYIANVDSRAFSWHVDRWDNVILQMQGRKVFDLEDGSSRELGPGDALFVPQDVEHRTRTVERSIHLSVAFLPVGYGE